MLLYLVTKKKKRNKTPIRVKKISNFCSQLDLCFNVLIENTHTQFYTVSNIDRAVTNYKKKRWMTVEINIVVGFFSSKYGIFYFCPKRT
jgi:hypothetical protein